MFASLLPPGARRVAPILFAVLVGFAGVAAPAAAQPQDFNAYTLNGSAALSGSALVLTTASGYEAGSAFNSTPIATAGIQTLTANFNYTIGGGSGAAGLGFVIQGLGPTALGGYGGYVGYTGGGGANPITNSVGAFFRTFSFNFPQVGTNGSFNGNTGPVSNLRGTHNVTVNYAAATQLFSVLLDGTQVVSQSGINLATLVGPQAYFGFTAGTGSATDMQQINSFSVAVNAAAPSTTAPEPSTWALLAAGLGGLARRRARA